MKDALTGVPLPFPGWFRLRIVSVEWNAHRDADLMVDIWNTEALLEAVLAALLDDPEAMRRAVELLGSKRW